MTGQTSGSTVPVRLAEGYCDRCGVPLFKKDQNKLWYGRFATRHNTKDICIQALRKEGPVL